MCAEFLMYAKIERLYKRAYCLWVLLLTRAISFLRKLARSINISSDPSLCEMLHINSSPRSFRSLQYITQGHDSSSKYV